MPNSTYWVLLSSNSFLNGNWFKNYRNNSWVLYCKLERIKTGITVSFSYWSIIYLLNYITSSVDLTNIIGIVFMICYLNFYLILNNNNSNS